ncbi:MAG: hypothetical protein ACE368_14015 [Paracoccaceae bacterium]
MIAGFADTSGRFDAFEGTQLARCQALPFCDPPGVRVPALPGEGTLDALG